jgi:hypothetical protein
VEGATKSVEIEFLKEDFVALIELMVRDEDGETNIGLLTAKVNDAFAVATSMVGFYRFKSVCLVQKFRYSGKMKMRETREKATNFDYVRFLLLGLFDWAIGLVVKHLFSK